MDFHSAGCCIFAFVVCSMYFLMQNKRGQIFTTCLFFLIKWNVSFEEVICPPFILHVFSCLLMCFNTHAEFLQIGYCLAEFYTTVIKICNTQTELNKILIVWSKWLASCFISLNMVFTIKMMLAFWMKEAVKQWCWTFEVFLLVHPKSV